MARQIWVDWGEGGVGVGLVLCGLGLRAGVDWHALARAWDGLGRGGGPGWAGWAGGWLGCWGELCWAKSA